jgi:prevent-host-death family protein
MLHDVGIREAKTNLSKLLKEVQKGREIIITERGKRIAKITAVDETSLPLSDRIKSMEASGILNPVPSNARPLPPPLPVEETGIAQRFLQEDRG